MGREITQRELRNDSGEIMRALDRGESFVVTRNGVAVGELVPLRRRRFVPAQAAVVQGRLLKRSPRRRGETEIACAHLNLRGRAKMAHS